MRIIGINALFLIPHQVGGTEYHLRSFVDALQKADQLNHYVIFCNRENYSTITLHNPNWKKVLCPISATSRAQRIISEQVLFLLLVKKHHCDILHSFGYFGPLLLPGVQQVITVHDANWRDYPEDFSLMQRLILKFLIEVNLATAQRVITDSEFSASRLVKHFPSISKKLQVIWPFTSQDFQPASKDKKKKIVLCVSGCYPHKKVLYALELWDQVARSHPDWKFVVVARNGQDETIVQQKARTTNGVEYHAKVPFQTLQQLYQQASVFVFPSVYEGFGYPVYEALQSGTLVLVGKKELYHPSAQTMVKELSFDLTGDGKLLSIMMTGKLSPVKVSFNFSDSADSIQQLLKVYASL